MECRKAFDLDGVLADKPPFSEKKWGRMNGAERKARKQYLLYFYANAKPLIKWDGESVVITSRKMEASNITVEWFLKYYNKIPKIYFLNESRNIENVVEFKAEYLKLHKITDFYEDNKKVLAGLKKVYPECNYHYVSETQEISPF